MTAEGDPKPPPESESILAQLEREFGPLPPDEVGAIGSRLLRGACATDRSFDRLVQSVDQLRRPSTWLWYGERLASLELQFGDRGALPELDLALRDDGDDPYSLDAVFNDDELCSLLSNVDDCVSGRSS